VLAHIVLLAQDDAVTAPGQIARDAGAVDPTADDEDIECRCGAIRTGRTWWLASGGGLGQEVSSLEARKRRIGWVKRFVWVRLWAYLFDF
jgi:hypothetical protein